MHEEADKIYRIFFNRPIPELLASRFESASGKLRMAYSPQEIAVYQRAIDTVKDLEALEIAARFSSRLPLLSLQLRLMVCLAETMPENRQYYINDRDRAIAGYGAVVWSGMRSSFKLIKGWFLLKGLQNG